jgi:Ca-activated chloride channel family protein
MLAGIPRTLSVAICLAIAPGLDLAARQQQPTFKSGARTVAVYTTVTDDDGRLVTDLARDDFEIYDNGKLQPITLFASEIQPITLVMMLDRSGSMRENFSLVEQAAEAFVRRLLPEDKVRVGSFSETIRIDPEDFTSDYEQLIGIIRSQLQPAGPTPLWNAVDQAMDALRAHDGRRVVLVFTDGVDEPRNFRGKNVSHKDAQKRAQGEDVMVYAVGLESLVPYGGRRAPLPGRGSLGLEPRMIRQKPDEGLEKIAAETGGGYFELTSADDLRSAFSRVAEELHRQYALGFEPAKLDGKTHKLEVRVKPRGMKARALKSYIASPEP